MTQSSNGPSKAAKVPSEFHFSEKWDTLIEQSLIRSAVGLAGGALAGLVLSRRGNVRLAFAAFGAGVGIGSAYTKTAMEFEVEKMTLGKRQ